jgi:hypothetical protein
LGLREFAQDRLFASAATVDKTSPFLMPLGIAVDA